MTIAHAIGRAWLSTGGAAGETTGAQNYDEFADEAEITEIISANPTSALAVEMPHRAPESVGRTFAESLADASARLNAAKSAGHYLPYDDVAVVYGITAPDGATAYGLWCMVDTDQISTSEDEPGLVIRNEDVFIDKVRERVALVEHIGHLLSPVLLIATDQAPALQEALALTAHEFGTPVVSDTDQAGRRHEIWPVLTADRRDELLAVAGSAELIVADGNHRSLAAQMAKLPRFLAVITTPESVEIQAYHRLIASAPAVSELVDRLRTAGAEITALRPPVTVPAARGTIHVYGGPEAYYAIRLPATLGAADVENLDHALVERVLMRDALGLDAGHKDITYVGGDYPPDWLAGEVDSGRAGLAVLIPPVAVADFISVNRARRSLPRKSTWFTPKARAGLVVAELDLVPVPVPDR
ncbi:MAG TPA: DUF1015 family protein [Micromonosporaceae bacterium]|nr:DUF1015 family protein [Micromonosporaceae bacterium]